ncbi:MAG: hypothetical protein ACKOYM_00050, partial [Actinomycetes bacterium]
MPQLTHTLELSPADLQRRLEPRDDVLILEAVDGDTGIGTGGSVRFTASDGPFWSYRRDVRWEQRTDQSW